MNYIKEINIKRNNNDKKIYVVKWKGSSQSVQCAPGAQLKQINFLQV